MLVGEVPVQQQDLDQCPGAVLRAPPQQPETRSPAPAGSYASTPDINYTGQPYVKHASVGSVRHLPDYVCGAGSALAGVR